MCNAPTCTHPRQLTLGDTLPATGERKRDPRAKTMEQWIAKVEEVSPGKFSYALVQDEHCKNNKTKAPIVCLTCGHQWGVTWGDLTVGRGCPKCAGNQRKTMEQWIADVEEVNPGKFSYALVTDEHCKTAKTKAPIICLACGHQWDVAWSNLARGTGCPKCGYVNSADKQRKGMDEWIAKAEAKHPGKFSYALVTDEHCKTAKTKAPIICLTCGHQWGVTWDDLTRGRGCPCCAGKYRKTMEQWIADVEEVNPGKFSYALVTDEHCKTSKTKAPIICLTCGHQWGVTWHNLTGGTGCPKCRYANSAEKQRKGMEQWIADAEAKHPGKFSYALVTDEHCKTAKTKAPIVCLTCGHQWGVTWGDLTVGRGCPKCAGKDRSKDEWIAKIEADYPGKFSYALVTDEHCKTSKTKAPIICLTCGHQWGVTWHNLTGGRGCPCCAFNGEHKNGHGYLYLLVFSNESGQHIKFGITYDMQKRVGQHRSAPDQQEQFKAIFAVEVICSIPFATYQEAEEHERALIQLMADKGIAPLYGREHFPESAAFLVLDYMAAIKSTKPELL